MEISLLQLAAGLFAANVFHSRGGAITSSATSSRVTGWTDSEDDADDGGSIAYTATWQRHLITGIEKKLVKNRNDVPDGVAADGITYLDANGRVPWWR